MPYLSINFKIDALKPLYLCLLWEQIYFFTFLMLFFLKILYLFFILSNIEG